MSATAKITAAVGDIFTPMEESSKNLMRPAPEEGIGAEPERLLLRLDFLDILNYKLKIILIYHFYLLI